MDRSDGAALGVVSTLVPLVLALAAYSRRLRAELRICREDAQLLERRWAQCREELRAAQRLE